VLLREQGARAVLLAAVAAGVPLDEQNTHTP
jgi:hypothetical protein